MSQTALDHLRSWHLRRATGTLVCDIGDRQQRLRLVDGELHLAADNAIAERIAALQSPASRSGDRHAWRPLLERLAASLDQGRVRFAEFEKGLPVLPASLSGPLPTSALLRIGYARRALRATDSAGRWTPPDGLLEAVKASGEAADGLGWSEEELWVLERLLTPRSRDELRAECPFGLADLDGVLAGLMAVERVAVPATPRERTAVAIDELAKKLAGRIGQTLARSPLEVTPAAFRRRVAELLVLAGEANHGEFLGIAPEASVEEIQAAFEELGRWVHPGNADRFGLADRREALGYLFERATEAYRTLADPQLRAAYYSARDLQPRMAAPEPGARQSEAAEMARRFYDRALYEEGIDEIFTALSLVEQAVRTDPRSEYWCALGRLQARNSAWIGRAIESYRSALELDPESGEIRFALGELYEKTGDLDQARAQYLAATNASAPHAGAREALTRVNRQRTSGSGPLGRLFGRS